MDPIDELLTRGVDHVYPSREALEAVLQSGKKLTLYQGFDPTGTQFHIGHAVGLRKLKQFQQLGHHVIFLIGDFTAMIGDPSGKLSSRKVLTQEEVMFNAKHYQEQASRILDFSGPNPVELKYNSTWLGKMSAIEFLELSHNLTYQQVIERDMFQKRIKEGQDISMNEFLYPFMQAYDSVAMNVDLEIGGSDQMFNMMMGRKLMRNILKKEKFVLTTPLLTDSMGNKIGKTEGNVIGITDPPNELFGKIMSLSDDIIVKALLLLSDLSQVEIQLIEEAIKLGENPVVFKKRLAFELVKQYNSLAAAQTAQTHFESVFQKQGPAANIPAVPVSAQNTNLIDLLKQLDLNFSNSQLKRVIGEGGVELNNQKITDPLAPITPKSGDVIKFGKHTYFKLHVTGDK